MFARCWGVVFERHAADFTLEKNKASERPDRVNTEAARKASLKYYYKMKADPESRPGVWPFGD